MNATCKKYPWLVGFLLPGYRQLSQSVGLQITLGTFLLCTSSQISIPLQPVPLSLQSVAALYLGLVASPATVVGSFLSWFLLGLGGIPVFQGSVTGFAKFLGPTGGYLFGMALGSWGIAYLRRFYPERSWRWLTLWSLLGTGVTFFFGVARLAQFIGFPMALSTGLFPFIVPGVLKTAFLVGGLQLSKPWAKALKNQAQDSFHASCP